MKAFLLDSKPGCLPPQLNWHRQAGPTQIPTGTEQTPWVSGTGFTGPASWHTDASSKQSGCSPVPRPPPNYCHTAVQVRCRDIPRFAKESRNSDLYRTSQGLWKSLEPSTDFQCLFSVGCLHSPSSLKSGKATRNVIRSGPRHFESQGVIQRAPFLSVTRAGADHAGR